MRGGPSGSGSSRSSGGSSTCTPPSSRYSPGSYSGPRNQRSLGSKCAGERCPGVRLMHPDGTEVGVLKSLQKEGESVTQAEENDELAASIDGAVIGRNLKEGDLLLVSLSESAARALRGQPLSSAEQAILEEVVHLHRATHPFWGQ